MAAWCYAQFTDVTSGHSEERCRSLHPMNSRQSAMTTVELLIVVAPKVSNSI